MGEQRLCTIYPFSTLTHRSIRPFRSHYKGFFATKEACLYSKKFYKGTTFGAKPENNTNRPGWDYDNFEVSSPSVCEQTCQEAERCWAWTYVRPGVQGRSARCWLKDRVPPPNQNRCCISGYFTPRSEGVPMSEPKSVPAWR